MSFLGPIPDISSTHHALRDASQDLHQILDKEPVFLKLLSADLSAEEYILALSKLYLGMSVLESAVLAYEQNRLMDRVPSYLQRVPYLKADLQNLGASLPEKAPDTPLTLHSSGAYLGTRYVLEGASLGSAHMCRNLLANHQALTQRASSYWYFQEAQAMGWPIFLNSLAILDDDDAQKQQAILATVEAFEIFIAAIDGGSNAG